jgi:sugar-phosphatase
MSTCIPAFSISCKAILFDLDGTLVDSVPRIRRLWESWGQARGISSDAISQVMHGRQAAEIIRLVAPQLNIETELKNLEADEVSDMNGVRPYAAAFELLSGLLPGQWAIVTSGTRHVAEARMQHVKLPYPSVFVTADDVQRSKPAPDGFLLAARRLHVQPSECVVIEDAPAGVRAGKASGMSVIAVATSHSPHELHEADQIVAQLADIKLVRQEGGMILHSGS